MISKNCKEFINYGYKQIIFQKELVKLKLKIYGVQKKIDADLAGLGDEVYSCFENGRSEEITGEKNVNNLINVIKGQREEIKITQDEINKVKEDIGNISRQLRVKGKDVMDEIKNSLSPKCKHGNDNAEGE